MKNLLFIFVGLVLVGCASTEISVPASPSGDVAIAVDIDTDLGAVGAEPLVATSTPLGDVEMVDTLVDWGFVESARTGGDIDTVIIHSVYNPFVEKNRHSLEDILDIFEDYGVAPHYIIDREGTVHRSVLEKDIAWHAGRSRVPDGRVNVNDFSLGIEMVNALGDTYTDAQYKALRGLLGDIEARYAIKYVLGHDEIAVEDPWDFDWSQIDAFRHEPRG